MLVPCFFVLYTVFYAHKSVDDKNAKVMCLNISFLLTYIFVFLTDTSRKSKRVKYEPDYADDEDSKDEISGTIQQGFILIDMFYMQKCFYANSTFM